MKPFSFKPVSHSWVALHPQAKGAIQFIGGAFFGTFAPTFFYRYLLRFFYEQDYTIIVYPFAFSFNHYKESFFLLREQYLLIPELVSMAAAEGAEPSIYLSAENYIWLGHSIGCKYIALLEAADQLPSSEAALKEFLERLFDAEPIDDFSPRQREKIIDQIQYFLAGLRDESRQSRRRVVQQLRLQGEATDHLEDGVTGSVYADLFIRDQASVLLAPVNSNTSDAIKPKAFADWVDRLGWGVNPSPGLTRKLITMSQLFNLLVLASFGSDNIARETVKWFTTVLKKPPKPWWQIFDGGHFRPLGVRVGKWVINPMDRQRFVESVDRRDQGFERLLSELLTTVKKTL
ncbi:MAG: DUF1350 family protein [Cyanobacteriota bacterium]|nr:DUF1350 family protein [Cyanobacteriota bacterium]